MSSGLRVGVGLAPVLVLWFVGAGWAQAPPAQPGSVESEHFVVRFDPELDWILAEPALEALEAGRASIGAWLGEQPAARLRVEIMPAVGDFERAAGLGRREIEEAGAVGFAERDRIAVLSPRLLLRGYPWRDTLNRLQARLALQRAGAAGAPAWVREGFARLVERRWRSPEAPLLDDVDASLVARALRENALPPLADVERALVRPAGASAARLALAASALAVEHVVDRHGADGLRRLVAALGAPGGGGLDAALGAATGESAERFEAGWRAAVAGRGFRELDGVVLAPLRLAGQGTAEEWELSEWQPLAAANHLRLGDLLRARGNGRAALIEYEKARTAAPGSPYAHVKVARMLLELGRAEEAAAAAAAARSVGDGYPAASVALAAALAAGGDHDGAAAALRDALELNPFDRFAWRDLGRVLRRLGRQQEAQRASVNALRLAPNDQQFMQSVMEDP